MIFFFGGVTATAPSRDLTDNKKKEDGGLKQRRKQEEAAQGDPEPGKGNQEKEKDPSRVQSWGSAGQKTQKKTRRMDNIIYVVVKLRVEQQLE